MSQSQKTTRRSGLKDGDAAASPGSPDGHPPSPFSCNLADYGSMDAPDAVKTLRLLFTHVSSSPNRRFTKDYLSVANRLVEILEDSMSSQSNPMEARLSSIEASLSKVTNILSSQSFAPPPPVVTQPAAPLVKERTSKGNTRGANDVVISTARVNKEHVILKSNPVELSTLVQNAIRNCGVAELAGIEIHGVKTLRRDQIMVRARCDQEAKLILEQADKWTEKLAEGAKVSKEQYKVVASRVPTTFDPSAMTAKDVIHQSNKILIPRVSNIMDVRWLNPRVQARGDAGPVKSHSSLIITMDDKSAADELILRGVSIGGMLCDVHRYIPPPVQCYNCQGYGHISHQCPEKGKPTCPRCSGQHRIQDCHCPQENRCKDARTCTHIKVKCANCGDAHTALHYSCPSKVTASDQAAPLPPYFDEARVRKSTGQGWY